MITTADAITASAIALAGATTAIAAALRAGHEHHAEPAPSGPSRMGYRLCPAEDTELPALLHRDGSATCDRCGTHIPAGDS